MQPWMCSAWGVPSVPCLNRQICNMAKWPPVCQSSHPTNRPAPGDKVLYFWLSTRGKWIHYLLPSWKIHFRLIIQTLSQKRYWKKKNPEGKDCSVNDLSFTYPAWSISAGSFSRINVYGDYRRINVVIPDVVQDFQLSRRFTKDKVTIDLTHSFIISPLASVHWQIYKTPRLQSILWIWSRGRLLSAKLYCECSCPARLTCGQCHNGCRGGDRQRWTLAARLDWMDGRAYMQRLLPPHPGQKPVTQGSTEGLRLSAQLHTCY